MNVVDMKKVYKSYEDGKIKALNGIDLTITEGEFVSIIGEKLRFQLDVQNMTQE